jgi:large subunit ribosomal protein L29
MKTSELRAKNNNDLKQMLQDSQRALATLNFDLASGKVKNIKEMRQARRGIAQIMTIMREVELKESKV